MAKATPVVETEEIEETTQEVTAPVVSPIAVIRETLTELLGEETANALTDAYIETNHQLKTVEKSKPMWTMIRRGQTEFLALLGIPAAVCKGVMGELYPRAKKAPKPKAPKAPKASKIAAEDGAEEAAPVVKKTRKSAAPATE
jgi:hypothetical protein